MFLKERNEMMVDGLQNTLFTWTFHIDSSCSPPWCQFVKAVQRNDNEGIGYCEYHPDVNHLDVPSHWQSLRNSHKAENKINK